MGVYGSLVIRLKSQKWYIELYRTNISSYFLLEFKKKIFIKFFVFAGISVEILFKKEYRNIEHFINILNFQKEITGNIFSGIVDSLYTKV